MELDRGTAESLNESYELYGRIHYVPDDRAGNDSEHGYYFEPDAETELMNYCCTNSAAPLTMFLLS